MAGGKCAKGRRAEPGGERERGLPDPEETTYSGCDGKPLEGLTPETPERSRAAG